MATLREGSCTFNWGWATPGTVVILTAARPFTVVILMAARPFTVVILMAAKPPEDRLPRGYVVSLPPGRS